MHRTEGTHNFGNLFTDGPPGTTVEEDWLNAIQEEVCNVIIQAGLTLKTASTETRNQLYTAIQTILTSLSVMKFSLRSSAPASPIAGDIVMADRINWNPLDLLHEACAFSTAFGLGFYADASGAYLTMYLGSVNGWGAITGQLD